MKHNFKSIILLITWGCANVAMPTGGPRDENPPAIDTALSTPNFQTKFSKQDIKAVLKYDPLNLLQ